MAWVPPTIFHDFSSNMTFPILRRPKLNFIRALFYKYIPAVIISPTWFKIFLELFWERCDEGYLKLKLFQNQICFSTQMRHSPLRWSWRISWGSRLRRSGDKSFMNNIRICNCLTKPWKNIKLVQLVPLEHRHLVQTPQQEQAKHTGSSKIGTSHEGLKSRKIVNVRY